MTLVPLNDAVQQLVNTEDGSAVRDVMVGGEYVLRDFQLTGVDRPRIVMRARRRRAFEGSQRGDASHRRTVGANHQPVWRRPGPKRARPAAKASGLTRVLVRGNVDRRGFQVIDQVRCGIDDVIRE